MILAKEARSLSDKYTSVEKELSNAFDSIERAAKAGNNYVVISNNKLPKTDFKKVLAELDGVGYSVRIGTNWYCDDTLYATISW